MKLLEDMQGIAVPSLIFNAPLKKRLATSQVLLGYQIKVTLFNLRITIQNKMLQDNSFFLCQNILFF